FYDPNDRLGLSQTAYQFIAGIMAHARALAAITNPTVNSYKRLVPGYEAPVYIAWSPRNRSPLIRVPAKRGASTRIEVRHPDPSCNPYLALAVLLKAGLDGIKKGLTPPPPTDKNIFAMSPAELRAEGIGVLPGSLDEALAALAEDEVIKEALGPHIYERLTLAQKLECEQYRTRVHQWEIDQYLTKF
ncbi:MAG: type I glutamate--ammonia ligase, partial [Moorella sp. (in: Bacteria)]|nr:type I glutamate--ammonia ligase [Moorella sp. (in: firmicutes)]